MLDRMMSFFGRTTKKPIRRKPATVRPWLEALEARRCPSTTGYWNPIPGILATNQTWQYVAPGGSTNWTTDAAGHNRIVDNGTSGYPGEYGTAGVSSDVANFTGNNNTSVYSSNPANALEPITIGGYSGTITIGGTLKEDGGAGAGHFTMNGGTIDLYGGGLSIQNTNSSSGWGGGTITDTFGGGTFGVSASSGGESTALAIAGAVTLKANMTINGGSASKTATVGLVADSMSTNMVLGSTNSIEVNQYGNLNFLGNPYLPTKAGGIDNGGTARTSYGVVVNGGTLKRGTNDGTTGDGVLINVPVENQNGGTVEVCYGYSLQLGNGPGISDPNHNALYQTGTASKTQIDCNPTSTGSTFGTLLSYANIDINGGEMILQAGNSATTGATVNFLDTGVNGDTELNVDNGATLWLRSLNQYDGGGNAKGYGEVSGVIRLNNGSTFEDDGNGTYGKADELTYSPFGNLGVDLGSTSTFYLNLTDGDSWAGWLDSNVVIACTNETPIATIIGTFGTVYDTNGDAMSPDYSTGYTLVV